MSLAAVSANDRTYRTQDMDDAASQPPSSSLSLTSPNAGWFITSLIFVGMLFDGLMTILCCVVFCISFMLCCGCMAITDRRRRCLDWPCAADGAPFVAVVDDDRVDYAVGDESNCVARSPDAAGKHLLLETPVLLRMPSFPEIPCSAFFGAQDEAIVCTVCQSGIDDGELAVELPICEHFFHVECVYPWLGDHLTCPNCRVCVSDKTPTTSTTTAITVVPARRR